MKNSQHHIGVQNQRASRRPTVVGLCVVASSVLGIGFVAQASDPVPQAAAMTDVSSEVFAGITPVRLLDTRSGVGAPNPGPFGPGETRTVIAAGFESVPADATGIAINVTLPQSASSSSFVTVWPSGLSQPETSTSNATPGQAVPNSAITALGADGGINLFNEQGETHIVIDIVGYYVSTDSVDIPGGVLYNGSGAPSNSVGLDGDFYIDEVETDMYMKEAAQWGQPMIELAADEPHMIAADGAPSSSDGIAGDVYLDTADLEIYGPKVGNSWGAGQPVGPDGVGTGESGSNFLKGSGVPLSSLGAEGDLYLDSTNAMIFGPKSATSWGAGVDVGPDGGPDGVGSNFLKGSGVPLSSLGAEGDLYLDSTNAMIFGPKSATSWGAGVDVGPDGSGEGSSVLFGAFPPDSGDGEIGDLYLDSTTLILYGPKEIGGWTGVTIAGGAPTASTDSAVGATAAAADLLVDLDLGVGVDLVIAFPQDVIEVGSALTFTDAHTITVNTTGTYKVSYSVDRIGVSVLGEVNLLVGPNAVESDVLLAANGSVDQVRLINANATDTIRLGVDDLSLGLDITASIVVELVAVS